MKVLFNGFEANLPNSRKKIAGGPQIFTSQLLQYMQSHKYKFVGLVLNSDKSFQNIYEIAKIQDKGGQWLHVKTALNLRAILESKTADIRKYTTEQISMLSKIIANENPDVILLNSYSMPNWYILRAAAVAKIPVVVSHHGLLFKEVPDFERVSMTFNKIMEEMERDIIRYSKHEIFLNEFSLKEFESMFGKIPKAKRSVIPISYNPVFLKHAAAKKQRVSDVLKVGFVGRWHPIKNPQIVLKLARQAKKQKLKFKFFAVTTFKKSKRLDPYIKKFSENVEVIPNLKSERLQKFYKKMDILLLPSRFDLSPTVVAEAAIQHRGTMISKNVGWVSEYNKFGMADWISDFDKPKETLALMEKLAAQGLPEEFVKHIKEYHSVENVLSKIFKVLKAEVKHENSAARK